MDVDYRGAVLDSNPTIYGCCGIFDMCDDSNLMSLSFQGAEKFLDWLGWERTKVCMIKKNFITYIQAETLYSEGGSMTTEGWVSDPCGPSSGAEWGGCDFILEDWGRLRRHGPVRDATKATAKLCEQQPRYRLDGSPITGDMEFDMRLATEVLMQDLKRLIVSGSFTTAGQFDGLESLVRTGYQDSKGRFCSAMDSIVIDWNANPLSGGPDITWNGAAQPEGHNFVDYLLAILRRVRDRIQMAPQLASQPLQAGDIIFLAPSHVIRAVLDAYTCWSVCPGQAFNETNLNTYEARAFRNNLMGGMFGAGKIYLDSMEIPMMPYNWELIKGPTLSDAYILTGRVGAVKTINGQYYDMTSPPADYPDGGYRSTDGGRLLTWLNRTQTCVQREVEMQPRLLMWAPWAQARFQNIKVNALGGIIGPDPLKTSFFPDANKNGVYCGTSFNHNGFN
jgi:hypothetical protein